MKRHSHFINKKNGFFFPYVMFLTTLVMITVMAGIQNYQRELQITSQQINQLRIETLFQMGRKLLKDELINYPLIESQGQVTYDLPDGVVTIHFLKIENGLYQTEFQIYTDSKTNYTFTNKLIVPYDDEEIEQSEELNELEASTKFEDLQESKQFEEREEIKISEEIKEP